MVVSLLDPEFFNPSASEIKNDLFWSKLAQIITLDGFAIGPNSFSDISLKAHLLYSAGPSNDPAIGYIFSILNERSLPPQKISNNISISDYRPVLGDPQNHLSLQNDIQRIDEDICLLSKPGCWPENFEPQEFKMYNFSDDLEILRWRREKILLEDDCFSNFSSNLKDLFPNIIFLDSVFQRAENLHTEISLEQETFHNILIHHLSVLNDYGSSIMQSDRQNRVKLFRKYGVEASGNSSNERNNSKITQKRVFNFGEKYGDVRCEWHTKINSGMGGRIYFSFRNDKILIGSICRHL